MEVGEMVPPQKMGGELNVAYSIDTQSAPKARRLFETAVGRLLQVNEWDRLCGILSATFFLTDKHGNAVNRKLKPGDYFRIRIPGPGSLEGEGYDWVRIEALEDQRDPSGPVESLAMRVRPAPNPMNNNLDTAHFFSDEATSTFLIHRQHNKVEAVIHGRNEVPNVDTERTVDKVRNTVVAMAALSVASNIQWTHLVKGLIEGPGENTNKDESVSGKE